MKAKKSVVVTTMEVVFPTDLNHHDTLFGGKLMAWMDKAAYYAAFQYGQAPAVTASVESLDFAISPKVGDLMEFHAKVIFTGRSSMVIRVDAFRTDVHNNNDRKLANTGFFTFVAVSKGGKPKEITPLLVETEEERINWNRGKAIKDAALARHKAHPVG